MTIEFFKDTKNAMIFAMAMMLTVSIGANVYFFWDNSSSHASLDKMRAEENKLIQQNAVLEEQNRLIQLEKDQRTVAIDSLKKVIDGYEATKKERDAKTVKAVKKTVSLGAHQSLNNFMQWTE